MYPTQVENVKELLQDEEDDTAMVTAMEVMSAIQLIVRACADVSSDFARTHHHIHHRTHSPH